jgi:hypothetical protein
VSKWVVIFLFFILVPPQALALEYKMTIRTETGTYYVYKASWTETQRLAEKELPYPGMIWVSFAKVPKSPGAKGMVIYSEDPIEVLLVKTLGRFFPKRWLHPLYREIHNVKSFENLRKAAERDREAYEKSKRWRRMKLKGEKPFFE